MKKYYLLFSFLFFSILSSAQTFRIYTAKANGNWSNASTWNSVVRSDNVKKNKYFIPANFTVVATANFDYTDLGDVDVVVAGTLRLASNVIFGLTQASSIDVFPDGEIESQGASAIFISNSIKYFSFGARSLSGPAYTDFSIPGFANFTTLTTGVLNLTGTSADQIVSLKWSANALSGPKRFDVEFSSNGTAWTTIGTVHTPRTSDALNHYDFSYRNAGSMGYFRLKQWGVDGSFSYSSTITIAGSQPVVMVYAANRNITVKLDGDAANYGHVKVLDLNGFVLKSKAFNSAGIISFPVQELKPGTYIVHITNEHHLTTVKRVIIF